MAKRDYEVGYGKPPLATRFVKGKSGNPSGRPRGRRNLAATLLAVLNEPVMVTEQGRRKRMTKLEATFKQLVNRSVGGDLAATRVLVQLFPTIEKLLEEPATGALEPNADHTVLAHLVARLGLDRNSTHNIEDCNDPTATAAP
jgi:hypothetical protein